MNLDVEFQKRNFTDPLAFPDVEFDVQRYSFGATGGPDDARINVYGDARGLWELLEWIRAPVTIVDELGDAVWWGYLDEATVRVGAIEVGVSLKEMSNRIAVAYSYVAPTTSGAGTRATTTWSQDDDSVSAYGTKERLSSLSRATPELAEAKRDTILDALKYPVPVVRAFQGEGGLSASLVCKGWWYSLDWQYYNQPSGLEEHADGSATQDLGLGTTSSKMGFETTTKYVSDINAGLGELDLDEKFVVSGSASNNGTFTVASGTAQEQYTFGPAATVSFEASTKKIKDSANGLGEFSVHDVIEVSGSNNNDGYYRIESVAANGSEMVVVQSLADEGAGASVTIVKGHHISVEEALTTEMPGNTVTVTAYGKWVAQSFSLTANTSWTVAGISVNIRKLGSPTDAVKVALHADAAGLPGSELDSGTISASNIGENLNWVEAELSNTVEISYGTTYWIVVSRTGSNDPADFYQLAVDEDLGYANGVFKVWDGSAYQNRPTDADMLFRIGGEWETTRQIEEAVTQDAEFITGLDIVDGSGVWSSQYRDGDTTVLQVVQELLDAGSSNGRRMIATVTRERELKLYEEPAAEDADDATVFLLADGQVQDKWGNRVTQHAPAGEWCALKDVIPPTLDVGLMADPTLFFVERSEYIPREQSLLLEPKGTPSPWELTRVSEG